MTSPTHPTRRALMAALSSLPVAGAAQSTLPDNGRMRRVRSPVLVAYFSRTGNTRVVAGLLERATGADVFEIRPAVAYPDEYLATVEQARVERDRGVEPALERLNSSIAGYETVFLGFPIWGETAPPIIRGFLSKHDLAGKTLIPFITHGGYGLGDSEAVIKRHATKAVLQRGFSMQADQERQTMDKVTDWLRNAKLAR